MVLNFGWKILAGKFYDEWHHRSSVGFKKAEGRVIGNGGRGIFELNRLCVEIQTQLIILAKK